LLRTIESSTPSTLQPGIRRDPMIRTSSLAVLHATECRMPVRREPSAASRF